jgi:hypothetical protein
MSPADSSLIYDDLMRFKPEGMSPNAWAMKAGVSRTVWSDMRRHGNPSRRTLQKLLTAAGSSLAEFEALRIGGVPLDEVAVGRAVDDRHYAWGAPQLAPLRLLATAIGGEWGHAECRVELTELRTGEIVDRVPRPVGLANRCRRLCGDDRRRLHVAAVPARAAPRNCADGPGCDRRRRAREAECASSPNGRRERAHQRAGPKDGAGSSFASSIRT